MTSPISTLSPHHHFSKGMDEKTIKKKENKEKSAYPQGKAFIDHTVSLIKAEVFRIDHLPPQKSARACSKIMALEPITPSSSISTGKRFSISPITFSRAEKKMINNILKKWALSDDFCFLDIWGVEIFQGIERLKEYFSIEELRNDFLSNFVSGYDTLQLIHTSKPSFPSPQAFYTSVCERTNSQHFLSLEGLVAFLQNFNNKLSTYQTSSAFSDETNVKKNASIEHIRECVKMGIKFINRKTSFLWVTDLSDQMERYFPAANNLKKLDIKKNLEDLNHFIKFSLELVLVSVKRKELMSQENYFSHLSTQFFSLKEQPDLFKAMCLFKNELIRDLIKQKKCSQRYEQAKTLARLGKFSYPQFCTTWKTHFVESEVPENMFDFLHARESRLLNIEGWVVSILQMLDTHFLLLLNPEYHCKSVFINRFGVNLAAMQGKAPSSILIDSDYGTRSKSILVEINKQIEALYKSLSLKIVFKEMQRKWEILGVRGYPVINVLVKIEDTFLPSLVHINERTQVGLNDCRLQHLALIREFFQTLDEEELQTKGSAWIEFFKNICFEKALRFCRIVFMLHDLNQIMGGSQNVPEEELLPSALIDYMSLEGIDDMYADLLSMIETDLTIQPTQLVTDLEIVSDVLSVPTIKKKKKKERKLKSTSPGSTVPVKKKKKKKKVDSFEPFIARETRVDIQPKEDARFKIAHNEKVRKVLARLIQEGFLPKRKVKSSHVTLFNEEKGKMTVIPRSGKNHTQLKRGTAVSIQKQVDKSRNPGI